MKFVVAPDSYKGSLSAAEVAEAIAAGIGPAHETRLCPLADGGEGTTAVLEPYLGVARRIVCAGVDIPVFELDGASAALIESARFVGLHEPGMAVLPLRARGSTALGSAMNDALEQGTKTLVVTLGGSATHDMGLGALTALGGRFSDVSGQYVTPDLDGLLRVENVDLSCLRRFDSGRLIVLCDVETPLVGEHGATRVFAPQKGLARDEIRQVEGAVERISDFLGLIGGVAGTAPRTGAAGGLGFALALLGGQLVSGADWIMARCGLADALVGADWLVTGEGRSDAQTLTGKLPLRAAILARRLGVRTALISGSIDPGAIDALDAYFDRRCEAAFSDGRHATAERIGEIVTGLTRDLGN